MRAAVLSLLLAKAFAEVSITGEDGVVKTCGGTLTGTVVSNVVQKLEFTVSDLATAPKVVFDSCQSGTTIDSQLKVVTKVGYTTIARGQEGSSVCSGYRDILVATPNDGLEEGVVYELEIYGYNGDAGPYEIKILCGQTQKPTSRPTLRPTNRPIPHPDRYNDLNKCTSSNTVTLTNNGGVYEALVEVRENPNLSGSTTGATEGIACIKISNGLTCNSFKVSVNVGQNDYDGRGEQIYTFFEQDQIGECGGTSARKFCTATACFEGKQDACSTRYPCPYREDVGPLGAGTYPIQLITTTGVDKRSCDPYAMNANVEISATCSAVSGAKQNFGLDNIAQDNNNPGIFNTNNIIELNVAQLLTLVGGICLIIVASVITILLVYTRCIKISTPKSYNKIGYASSSADESSQLN